LPTWHLVLLLSNVDVAYATIKIRKVAGNHMELGKATMGQRKKGIQ